MSIRSNSLPLRGDLSWELQDLLRRNGMQGHIIREGDVWKLAVQGHDSPLITYNITPQQMKALCNWGSNYANKTAYNTFAELVEKDFYIPKNFVHARNANGRVAMGLHGYRIGVGEYGRMPMERAMMWGGASGISWMDTTTTGRMAYAKNRWGPVHARCAHGS